MGRAETFRSAWPGLGPKLFVLKWREEQITNRTWTYVFINATDVTVEGLIGIFGRQQFCPTHWRALNAERTLKKKDPIGNKRKKWKRKMCTNVSFLKRASWHPSMVKSRNGFCYHFVGAQLERCDRLHVDHFRCKYPPSLQKTTMACLNKIIMRLTLTELCSSVSSAIWPDKDPNLPILRVHY